MVVYQQLLCRELDGIFFTICGYWIKKFCLICLLSHLGNMLMCGFDDEDHFVQIPDNKNPISVPDKCQPTPGRNRTTRLIGVKFIPIVGSNPNARLSISNEHGP